MAWRAAAMREAVAGARGTARSADGSVTAVVAPGGALVSLELAERSVALGARQLQALIVDTIHQASADAAAVLAAEMRPLVGDQFDEAVRAAQSLSPEEPDELVRPAAAPVEDEDVSDQSVYTWRGER